MTNHLLAVQIIEELIRQGVQEFCISPGSRNSPLVMLLLKDTHFRTFYWSEERSSAFFAIGRCRASKKPVAVITTSGTAAGELLPAAMEAYYTGVPILLLTADRPKRFRGTGAPQTAEQLNLFGVYARFSQDLESGDTCNLDSWAKKGPAHINACFEEPSRKMPESTFNPRVMQGNAIISPPYFSPLSDAKKQLDSFFKKVKRPLVIISTLKESDRESVVQFLLKIQAPIYAEGISGLREDPRLSHLQIRCVDKIWEFSKNSNYHIDGVLRIGGVPTLRVWRDLEEKQGAIAICSINDVPFAGISWEGIICISIQEFFSEYKLSFSFDAHLFIEWKLLDQNYLDNMKQLFEKLPKAEPSLIHHLSKKIPKCSLVYLGNSLPIREWDSAAVHENKEFQIQASRGVNGIDGQISTFLGLCRPHQENWAIIGDLTALYDMAGPWILSQLDVKVNLVIINNGGGKIFSRMYPDPRFCHPHQLSFKPLAEMWGMNYARWESISNEVLKEGKNYLIEIVPDEGQTNKFWTVS